MGDPSLAPANTITHNRWDHQGHVASPIKDGSIDIQFKRQRHCSLQYEDSLQPGTNPTNQCWLLLKDAKRLDAFALDSFFLVSVRLQMGDRYGLSLREKGPSHFHGGGRTVFPGPLGWQTDLSHSAALDWPS